MYLDDGENIGRRTCLFVNERTYRKKVGKMSEIKDLLSHFYSELIRITFKYKI